MTEELLFKTYDLLDEIKEMPEYKRMKELKGLIKKELGDLLKEFHELRDVFNKLENPYSLEYKTVSAKLSNVKEKLYTEALVKEYLEKEKVIQAYLDYIYNSLVKVARGE